MSVISYTSPSNDGEVVGQQSLTQILPVVTEATQGPRQEIQGGLTGLREEIAASAGGLRQKIAASADVYRGFGILRSWL